MDFSIDSKMDTDLDASLYQPMEEGSVQSRCALLPPEAFKALEIFSTSENDAVMMVNSRAGTLFQHLNKCRSKDGERTMRHWMENVLTDLAEIRARHDVVEALCSNVDVQQALHNSLLREVSDIGVRARRLEAEKATLEDVFKLYQIRQGIPEILNQFKDFQEGDNWPSFARLFYDVLSENYCKLDAFGQIVEDNIDVAHAEATSEVRLRETKSAELNKLAEELKKVKQKAQEIFKKVDGKLDCQAYLENDQNRGYYFRVTITNEGSITRAELNLDILDKSKGQGVKFTNAELRQINEKNQVVKLLKKQREEQIAYTAKIFRSSNEFIPAFKKVAGAIGVIDVLVAFSIVASSGQYYARPEILEMGSGVFELDACRHPVVETALEKQYNPNDVVLGEGRGRFVLLMGANMGGKSTYLRAAALAAYMGQIGSFVACSSARFSVLDGIFTRVGADDNLDAGVSTFKAEMDECASTLRNATKNSFVVIDELGRGTSTDDGFGLAFAIAESIIKDIGAFTLYATHYHELSALRELYPDEVVTLKMDTMIDNGELIFLYQAVEGVADKSLGIKIAQMVGFPLEVIEEAKFILRTIEGEN